ncbi:MAG: hypothetical protein V1767_08865 [Chloroflexota bacterium]
MRNSKAVRNTGKLLIAIVVVLELLVPLFWVTPVQAANNPVDLVLGGEGATSWNVTGIKPGDSGIKTVTLRNAGNKDGFITIWVSDIVSIDGTRPGFVASNTTEPGELVDCLRFSLSSNGTNTNLNLPAAIKNFPQRVLDSKYIEIVPLKVGKTVNLTWAWSLPPQTGNRAQGDNVSFTINYLLRESKITDVSTVVTTAGVFTENVTVDSTLDVGTVSIEKGTVGHTETGGTLSEVWMIAIDKEPVVLSPVQAILNVQYDVGPNGTTFDRPVTITLAYDPNALPERAREENLAVGQWDENTKTWVRLDGSIIDTARNTISVLATHFSRYTIIAPVPPPPPQSVVSPPQLIGLPPGTSTLEAPVEGKVNKLIVGADGAIPESIRLLDSTGNFMADLSKGTKITGPDGTKLDRLDFVVMEKTAAEKQNVKELVDIPVNTIALSPTYRITGTRDGKEVSRVNFDPDLVVTITYDPKDLPENALPPFVINFTEGGKLIRLEPPPDSVFELGKAKGVASHASYFAVMTELAPPPKPLPAHFKSSNLVINPAQIRAGRPVSISIDITNEGGVTGTYELYLVIDGIIRAVKEVTVEPLSTTTVKFEASNLSAGEHQVKTAGLSGKFQVTSMAVVTEWEPVDWLLLDLSVVGLIVVGLLITYLVVRRSRQSQATK